MSVRVFKTRFLDALRQQTFPDDIQDSPEQIAEQVEPHLFYVIGGVLTEGPPTALGGCRCGGDPDVPEGFEWPTEESQARAMGRPLMRKRASKKAASRGPAPDEGSENPLPFVCQINLEEIQSYDYDGVLPGQGMLWFFCSSTYDDALGGLPPHRGAIVFDPNPGPLKPMSMPPRPRPNRGVLMPQRGIDFGPSLVIQEPADDGRLETKRFDSGIERAIRKALAATDAKAGAVRLLGRPALYGRARQRVPEHDVTLIEIDGDALSVKAFGEGVVLWLLHREELAEHHLGRARLLIAPGT